MSKKEKYLLVVSFLEGRNFVRRNKVKFIIEAKFDGEHLSSDPVDHNESIEINQELAWEIDKKSLHSHRLQRSCIKAICYAVSETGKENIGYVVLDIRSIPDGVTKPKWYQLLQPKYQKSKPSLNINIYIEDDKQPGSINDLNLLENPANLRPPSVLSRPLSAASSLNNSSDFNDANPNKRLKVTLVEKGGYFLIGKNLPNASTFNLTITLAFARNLIRLITNNEHHSSARFFFTYTLLQNQVTTQEFNDIVSCQINGERSNIRLRSTLENLRRFFEQQNELEISFCSDERVIAKCYFNWKNLLEKWAHENTINFNTPIVIDQLLRLEPTSPGSGRMSPIVDSTAAPVIGIQIILDKENHNEITQNKAENIESSTIHEVKTNNRGRNTPTQMTQTTTYEQQQQPNKQVIYKNQTTTITVDEQPRESVISVKSMPTPPLPVHQEPPAPEVQPQHRTANNDFTQITEEMQLKVAYELQLWKEAREKEFEQQLKKIEAKKFQALAEAFKQHDIEREIMLQKKMKECNELETVLKNSLSEAEKREKQLAINETQVARLKSDLHHEYENKLIELREASKRVQEKADHQVNLQKNKCESLEEELNRCKRQVLEWEKKYADKEAEFNRYKERENNRSEIKLQAELNMINLEKIELERKLEAMMKAKNHYKEQWTRALQEIAAIKKREELNAKANLKKQQLELEHLRMKYLAAEESELMKSDEKQLSTIKNELERLRLNSHRSGSETDLKSMSSIHNLENIDPNLQEHINRLTEERDTLLRTGVYSNTDGIIVELDKRIRDCLKEAKLNHNN